MSDIDQAQTASTATFVTALVFNAIVFGAQLGAFTLFRPHFKAIYEPRTYVPKKASRTSPLVPGSSRKIHPMNYLSWPYYLFKADHKAIKRANGLDAYFFVRFLRMMFRIFLPIWLVTWIVLLPVTSVGTQVGENEGLDRFIFGNVQNDKLPRYAAHLILVWASTFWIFYNIRKEMRHFVVTRQRHFIDPDHAKTVQANTVLITGIPARYLTHAALDKTFGVLPGGVKSIWINRDLKELPEVYDRRLAASNKLEAAETKLLGIAAKLKLKADKDKGKAEDAELAKGRNVVPEVPKDQRPTHKLGFLGLFGEKVDSIDWAREEIRVCTRLLEEGRSKIPDGMARGGEFTFEDDSDAEDEFGGQQGLLGVAGKVGHGVGKVGGRMGEKVIKRKRKQEISAEGPATASPPQNYETPGSDEAYPPLNSAFITFRKQVSAHLAGQVLVHHEPYRMSGKYIEVSPSDVIWGNLSLNPYEMNVRFAISWGITLGLILLWAAPVAFVGAVSNVYSLCEYSWLNWICGLPKPVVGIISGILPPVLLAVLMMLLPIVLRLLGTFEGIPKRSGVELSLMTRYFIFQVIHGFLIVTVASGITAVLKQAQGLGQNPGQIPTLLASKLPQASTFFLTYIILQGLSGTAGGFFQIVALAIYYVKLFILGSTPRSVFSIKYGMNKVSWGTLFPNITLLVVISLVYSIISPIMNGLACFTFFAFYQLYKYLFLYCYQQDTSTDTGGLFFPKAITHLFVGLYIQQICLAALFFLKTGNGVIFGAFTVVLIVFTAAFQLTMNKSYGPLLHALPLTLVDKMYVEHEDEEEPDEVEPEEPVAAARQVNHDPEQGLRVGGRSLDTRDDIPLREVGSSSQEEVHGEKKIPKSSETSHEQQYGFAHPAASRPQKIIWIPNDTNLGGMAEEEAKACRSSGVEAVCGRGAVMNEKGKVDVVLGPEGEGGPPDLY